MKFKQIRLASAYRSVIPCVLWLAFTIAEADGESNVKANSSNKSLWQDIGGDF